MGFGFRIKELVNGLIIAPIGGALVGLSVYIITTDASALPGTPIPQADATLYATLSGAITFAGILWVNLKDAIMTSREVKHEEAKEKVEELYLNHLIDELLDIEKEKMKKQIEELKEKQQQQKS